MAVCGNCGQASSRVRSRWDKHNRPLPDECPSCSPQSFEGKFTAPSDKKIWMGFEANPNEYEKRYDEEGVFYIRKPEYRAEQEEKLRQGCSDEIESQSKAEQKKRLERRTQPMSESEFLSAIRKARIIAEALEVAARDGIDRLN